MRESPPQSPLQRALRRSRGTQRRTSLPESRSCRAEIQARSLPPAKRLAETAARSILTARRRLLRQLIRRSSAGLCLRHIAGGVVYGFLRFGLPLLRACAESQQQNQCQQQGDRLLAGNSHSRSLPLIPLRRESNLPFLGAAMLFRPRSAGQVNCGAPAAPTAGGGILRRMSGSFFGTVFHE